MLEVEWDRGRTETLFLNAGLDSDIIRFSQKRTQHGLRDYMGGVFKTIKKSKSSYVSKSLRFAFVFEVTMHSL